MIRRSDISVLFMRRLMDAGVFSSEDQFYAQNMSPLPETRLDFWIRETITGDTIRRGTNMRTGRIFPTIVYVIAVPAHTGTALLDQKEREILDCFDLWNSDKCNFAGPGFAGEVKSMRVSDDFSNDIWCFRTITLNLSVHLYD